ncbi:uncharacterized protein GGS22DRAFT_198746 [Annulohypoxylon maeteangense]|uniref:uncharacterized protein n=1 Tax=Annulohypoxylon maeteangense TaxID=1927788 RepID=UPI002007F8FB|nr:uncharacterized protein GGS22DRAFT_198746 [Annulohypoxylon maeteangense]KAI0887488.1 hypothetical protein GGS22DRAFT_198746 [Annulohypoxylon maeteangense]
MSSIHSRGTSSDAGAKKPLCKKDFIKNIREITDKKVRTKNSGPKSQDKPKEVNEEKEPDRDLATGRILVDDGGSCLACTKKGLNCTLNYLGVEGVDKCAACKRSGAQYCIRQRPVGKLIPFRGPPWHNPNYFSVGAEPSPEEMREILQEHYQGQDVYCNGEYMREGDRNRFALPPFNGSDLPLEDRMENWKSADWKRVLPTWENASYYKDSKGSGAHSDATGGEEVHVSQDTIDYFRVLRKYPPRNIHFQEYMKEIGETW